MSRIASRLAKYKGARRAKGGARYLTEKELGELREKFQQKASNFFSLDGLERDCRSGQLEPLIEQRERLKTF